MFILSAHYDMIFLKPIDEELLHEIGKKYSRIVTVEDGSIKGGLGMAVIEFMADNGYVPRIKRIGIPDQFIEFMELFLNSINYAVWMKIISFLF